MVTLVWVFYDRGFFDCRYFINNFCGLVVMKGLDLEIELVVC